MIREVLTVNVLLRPRSSWFTRGVNSVPGATIPICALDGVRPWTTRVPGVQLPLQSAA